MERVFRRRPFVAALLVAAMAAEPVISRGQTSQPDQLRQELEAMKEQLRQVQRQMKKQEAIIQKQQAVIDKLAAGKPAVAAPGVPAPPPTSTAEAEEERIKRQVTEQIMRRIQPSLTAANKTFPSQFNPAIGLIIDTVGSYGSNERGNFELRAAELGISASVDPFARGYAIITGSNQGGFDVEEAAIVTTSLPYNLTFKGGQFFADFGRLSKFHDHDLPFVNRPIALNDYVGGESQADGAELNYLLPTSQYVTLTAGAYNKMGAENTRVDNTVPRDFSQFTYLGRAATFFSLTDANNLDLGTTLAYTPEVKMDNGAQRYLAGVDLTYRYSPLSQASYRGLVVGTEFLYNQEDRPIGGFPPEGTTPVTPLVFKRRDAVGGYSYVEARLTRRYYPGFLFDYAQDVDHVVGPTYAYSPYLTIWASEFQRLRFQYTRLEQPGNHDDQFFLQWTVILGSHVHSFKDR